VTPFRTTVTNPMQTVMVMLRDVELTEIPATASIRAANRPDPVRLHRCCPGGMSWPDSSVRGKQRSLALHTSEADIQACDVCIGQAVYALNLRGSVHWLLKRNAVVSVGQINARLFGSRMYPSYLGLTATALLPVHNQSLPITS